MISSHTQNAGLSGLNEQIAAAVGDAMFGKPGSAQEKQRQEFLSTTLSQTASKFAKSPEGMATINKIAGYSVLSSFAAGLLAGWLLWRKGR